MKSSYSSRSRSTDKKQDTAELETKIENINDEDLLRQMWKETKSLPLKGKIRAKIYSLREDRLKNIRRSASCFDSKPQDEASSSSRSTAKATSRLRKPNHEKTSVKLNATRSTKTAHKVQEENMKPATEPCAITKRKSLSTKVSIEDSSVKNLRGTKTSASTAKPFEEKTNNFEQLRSTLAKDEKFSKRSPKKANLESEKAAKENSGVRGNTSEQFNTTIAIGGKNPKLKGSCKKELKEKAGANKKDSNLKSEITPETIGKYRNSEFKRDTSMQKDEKKVETKTLGKRTKDDQHTDQKNNEEKIMNELRDLENYLLDQKGSSSEPITQNIQNGDKKKMEKEIGDEKESRDVMETGEEPPFTRTKYKYGCLDENLNSDQKANEPKKLDVKPEKETLGIRAKKLIASSQETNKRRSIRISSLEAQKANPQGEKQSKISTGKEEAKKEKTPRRGVKPDPKNEKAYEDDIMSRPSVFHEKAAHHLEVETPQPPKLLTSVSEEKDEVPSSYRPKSVLSAKKFFETKAENLNSYKPCKKRLTGYEDPIEISTKVKLFESKIENLGCRENVDTPEDSFGTERNFEVPKLELPSADDTLDVTENPPTSRDEFTSSVKIDYDMKKPKNPYNKKYDFKHSTGHSSASGSRFSKKSEAEDFEGTKKKDFYSPKRTYHGRKGNISNITAGKTTNTGETHPKKPHKIKTKIDPTVSQSSNEQKQYEKLCSAYGTGPVDGDGKSLLGLKALRSVRQVQSQIKKDSSISSEDVNRSCKKEKADEPNLSSVSIGTTKSFKGDKGKTKTTTTTVCLADADKGLRISVSPPPSQSSVEAPDGSTIKTSHHFTKLFVQKDLGDSMNANQSTFKQEKHITCIVDKKSTRELSKTFEEGSSTEMVRSTDARCQLIKKSLFADSSTVKDFPDLMEGMVGDESGCTLLNTLVGKNTVLHETEDPQDYRTSQADNSNLSGFL